MSDESEQLGDLYEGIVKVQALRKSWRGELVAYSSRPLTAALCYDRVVMPSSALDPRHSWPAWDKHFEYGMWFGPEDSVEPGLERRVFLSRFSLGENQGLLEMATVRDSAAMS